MHRQWQTLFSWAPESLQMVTAAMKLKTLASWKKNYDQHTQHIKKQSHYFTNKGPISQSYGFSSSHVWTLKLDHKESWAPKNWCFWTVVLRRLLRAPLSSCLQSFPASGSFPMSQFFPLGGQSIGISASASVLSMNIQDWFPLGWTDLISLQSKGLTRVFSNTIVQKHQFFGMQLSL